VGGGGERNRTRAPRRRGIKTFLSTAKGYSRPLVQPRGGVYPCCPALQFF